MTDIAVQWISAAFRGDWYASDGGLATDGGVHSAVCVSLFTWRRAEPGYQPPAGRPQNLNGWWADTYSSNQIGSRLWQLRYAVKTDQTTLLRRAEDFCLEALQWMVDDGVAAGVGVNCQWADPTTIAIGVEIQQPGNDSLGLNFLWAWSGPQAASLIAPTPPIVVVAPPTPTPSTQTDYGPDYEGGGEYT